MVAHVLDKWFVYTLLVSGDRNVITLAGKLLLKDLCEQHSATLKYIGASSTFSAEEVSSSF